MGGCKIYMLHIRYMLYIDYIAYTLCLRLVIPSEKLGDPYRPAWGSMIPDQDP